MFKLGRPADGLDSFVIISLHTQIEHVPVSQQRRLWFLGDAMYLSGTNVAAETFITPIIYLFQSKPD